METIGDMNRPVYGRYFTDTDTNAYLCQMWVQLDFDIIDLTFTKDGVETVIPVIMSPMDIAADGTPPLVTTKDRPNILAIILGIIILIIIVILLLKFCPAIIFVLGKILIFPFKCIGALFKAIGNSIKRRKGKKIEKREREIEHEKKIKRRRKQRESKSAELPEYMWTTDGRRAKRKFKSKENLNRDEIESYLDSIDWNDPMWSDINGTKT